MMKRILILWLAVTGGFSALALAPAPAPAGESTLSIPPIMGGLEKPKMLIVQPAVREPFAGQEQTVQELNELFLFDLGFSDAFRVFAETPPAAFLQRQDVERNNISYEDWRRLDVNGVMMDYIVKSELVPRGPGVFELDLMVYDLVDGVRVIGRAYGGPPHEPFARKNLRRAGHKATAEIISSLTQGQVKPITETRFAFVNSNTAKKIKEIFVIDYDGWKDSVQQITFFNSVTNFPDWSPDGNELAYISFKNNWPDVFVHNLAQGKVVPAAQFKGTNNTPRWLPDGRNLIFSMSAYGNPELSIIPKEGTKQPRRLTNNNWPEVSPDVSPDGARVAFVSNRVGSPQIYIMDMDGSNTQRISYVERKCESPFWSPVPVGGEYRIAFSGYYDNLQSDIYTVRPDGSDLQMLTEGKFENLNPTWSPDGQYIAFSSNRLGKHEIFIMPSDPTRLLPDGKKYYRVTSLAGENVAPSWSPN
ncbi:MAG: hypothetical protein ACE15F_03395 [bacterium]